MPFLPFSIPPTVVVWFAVLLPFMAHCRALPVFRRDTTQQVFWWFGLPRPDSLPRFRAPWDPPEPDRGPGWQRLLTRPVVELVQLLGATIVTSPVMTALAPWFNALPGATTIAYV